MRFQPMFLVRQTEGNPFCFLGIAGCAMLWPWSNPSFRVGGAVHVLEEISSAMGVTESKELGTSILKQQNKYCRHLMIVAVEIL